MKRGASELFFMGWEVHPISCSWYPSLTLHGLFLSCIARGLLLLFLVQPQPYCLICDNLLVYGHLTVDYLLIEHLHLNASTDTLHLRKEVLRLFFSKAAFWSIFVCAFANHKKTRGNVDATYDAKFHSSYMEDCVVSHIVLIVSLTLITFYRKSAVWRYLWRLITQFLLSHMHHY